MLDAVIQRAKAEGVKLTMCDGEVIYRDSSSSPKLTATPP